MSSLAVIAVIVVIVSGYTISYNIGMDEVVDILFTGMMDVAYAAHVALGLTAAGSISDGDGGIKLGDATGIAIFESDGHTYAAVTAFDDNLVQILNITNPANVTAAGSITDAGTNTDDLELNGAAGIAIFESDGHTYAAVTAGQDDGVQILNITNPANVTAAGSITDAGTNTDDLELNGAAGIAIFESDGHTYAAVTAYIDNGVQILNITNPASITAAGRITDNADRILNGAQGITIFESDGNTYAAVAVRTEKGVQILNITNPASITAAGNISNSPSVELDIAWGITTFESGGHTYAAVTGYNDDGVQILNITNPNHITAVDEIHDTPSLELNGPRGITTFNAGGHPYVAVAAGDRSGDGVQILDVSNPLNVTAVVSISDSNSLELDNALGITTFRSGEYTYIAVAANEDNGVQIIRIDGTNLDDTMAPIIILNGPDPVEVIINGAYDEQNARCTDNVDAEKVADVNSSAVNTSVVGIYTVYYNCTDAAGLSAVQVTRTVNVVAAADTIPPSITLNGPDPVEVIINGAYNEQNARCTDNVDAEKVADVDSSAVNTSVVGIYTVYYNCTDAAGLSAVQVTRTVNVVAAADTIPPSITLNGPDPVEVIINGAYDEQNARCTDNVDAEKVADVNSSAVNTSVVGIYTVYYNCTDAAGLSAVQVTRTVNVVAAADTIPPSITLNGPDPVEVIINGAYNEQNARCTDNVDAEKVADVDSSAVDTNVVGAYTVYYDCTDAAGLSAVQVTRTVNVVAAADTIPPSITLNGPDPVEVIINGAYNEQNARCTDNVDAEKVADVDSSAVDTNVVGAYTVYYDCTDAAGLSAVQVTRTVNVVAAADTIPPSITLNGPDPVEVIINGAYNEQNARCTDNVDAEKVADVDSSAVDTNVVGAYTVYYDCTDAAGLSAVQVTRTVNVVAAADTIPPSITLNGPDPVEVIINGAYNEQNARCTDNVDAEKVADVDSSAVDTNVVGAYTVYYNCTDAAGLSAVQVTRTVNVVAAADTIPPSITLNGPDPVEVIINGAYNEQNARCTDNVDAEKVADVDSSAVDTNVVGAYTVYYDCTDAAGNTATQVTRTVNVVATDTTPPRIDLNGPDPVEVIINGAYNEQNARCTDNVDAEKVADVDSSAVDTNVVGAYTVYYDCTDAAGNTATQVTRTVNVVATDTTPPRIDLNGPDPVEVIINGAYNEQNARCTDNVDAEKVADVDSSAVDTNVVGAYTVYYDCTDAAGNTATQVTRTVIVEVTSSNTPPVIPDTNRSSKSSRSNNTPNPLTVDNSIIIGEQNHDLVSGTTTINPHNITTGQSIDLVFTAYSPSDIVRFTVYLNLHGDEIKHSDSDTYIRYDRGAVEIVDPHGFISDASITITEDLEQSRKNIINTLVEFEGNMGLTNMAVYIWNEDRRYTSIRVFDALDITSGMGELPDPEPQNHNGTVGTTSPDIELSGADTLSIIRTWSGFEQGTVTDDELLQVLNLSYQGAHIPNWVMTDLAVLVSKGSVTTDEFVTALTYVLENI